MKKISKIILLFVICTSLFACSSKPKDSISGHSWQAADGSVVVFQKDGKFAWYREIEVKDDYYYSGTYKVYKGEKAIDFVDGLTQYGVTRKEQEDYIARQTGVTVDDYYCVEIIIDSLIIDHQETATEPWANYFVGIHYEKEKVLDFINMNAAAYVRFTLYEEK